MHEALSRTKMLTTPWSTTRSSEDGRTILLLTVRCLRICVPLWELELLCLMVEHSLSGTRNHSSLVIVVVCN
jgi:hypothetical protein